MARLRIVIMGASSLMAEHCARIWAQAPLDLVLVGRNPERVQRVADDLQLRSSQSHISVHSLDFNDASAIAALAEQITSTGKIDIVLIAQGNLPQQAECERDLALAQQALSLNGISPVLCAEAFAAPMARAGTGTIAVIGSVAGDRGRKTNYVYGAAKGMVERYVQGMQHRFAGTGLKVVLIKPGPTATPMTAHLPQAGLASVAQVAQDIVAAIAAGKPVVYVPAKWQIIMLIIRHLPRFIFNKLNI